MSSCREFDVIGVKSKGRGSKTCERFVTHNSQLVNDLEYGDDMHANYFSRHSTSPNHRACIPLLDSRRLRSRECRGVTVRSIQLRWYPFLKLAGTVIRIANFLTQGAYGSNPKKRFFQKRLINFFESWRPSRGPRWVPPTQILIKRYTGIPGNSPSKFKLWTPSVTKPFEIKCSNFAVL